MKLSTLALAALAASAGFAVARTRSATPVDEHADHATTDTSDVRTLTTGAHQSGLPASGATAAERIAASPRHAEWVAVKSGTDSIMSWVVYPERSDKAPVVIVLHENTGLTTWARAVAEELGAGECCHGVHPLSCEWTALMKHPGRCTGVA